jgi:hypothetical protein
MPYRFEEAGEVSCGEIADSLRSAIIGCRAVNSSFDSGRLTMPDWESVNGFPVSPAITERFIAEWPVSHDAYCDEWWLFDGPVPSDFAVLAFCNYTGMRIADYKQLDWPEGCPLDSYLGRFRPKVVFGNNDFGYVIART